MIIGITGCTKNLGRFLCDELSKDHDIIELSLRNFDGIIEQVNKMDVFINNSYHPTLQNKIFHHVFNDWKYEDKTIINILTSAVFNGGSLDEYRKNKTKIQKDSIKLSTPDKKVRVINVYPNTLEHNQRIYGNKLKHREVFDTINYAINLPQETELSHICISKTTFQIPKKTL